MRNPVREILGILGLLMLPNCQDDRVAGGTGTGNPTQGIVTFSMLAVSEPGVLVKQTSSPVLNPDTSFTVADAGGTVFTIRTAVANVGQVRFKLPEGLNCKHADENRCDLGEIKLQGPFLSDLMRGTFQPDIGAFRVPAGVYSRMDLRLETVDKAKHPIKALRGHSMLVSGTFDYAGKQGREFSFAIEFEQEIRYESGPDGGLTVRDKGMTKLILALNVEKWLARANITRCLESGAIKLNLNGDLEVDRETACENLEETLEESVERSGDMREKHEN